MKTPLTYGFYMGLASALLTLLLYFGGFHDTPEKMAQTQWVGMVAGIGIGATFLALAMREKRATFPPEEHWGYGSAFGVGVMTGLFGAIFGAVFAHIYFAYINPNFSDVVYQTQIAAMEERGMSAAQIDRAEPMMRKWMSPVIMTAMQCIMGFIWSVILAAIVAIFLRQRHGDEAPPSMAS